MDIRRKYLRLIAQNFGSSNACTVNCTNLTLLDFPLIAVGIENYMPVASQFLYLLLQTNAIPFLARKYKAKKYFHFGESRKDTVKMITYPNQVQLSYILKKFMRQFMPVQLPPENSAIKLDTKYLKLII